ncbi:MAG: type II toxin-antitoxin system VapC family toxin [Deltaproteobacteria bacterium]|nr:type II toxin-antitoxin system VapC family toxin [Deltaproteobacteria bacterium]
MASVYLDTSALVKLYIEEEGTARVAALTADRDDVQVVILDITLIESRSAIRRRQRQGDVSGTEADLVLKQIEEDAAVSFLLQPSTSAVMEEAARLIDRHTLRAYDALQLAGCLVVRHSVPGPVTFVCADTRLCEAASLEGVTTSNPLAS